MKFQIVIIAALVGLAACQSGGQSGGLLSNLPNIPGLSGQNGLLSGLQNMGGANSGMSGDLLQAPRQFLANTLQGGANRLGPNGEVQSLLTTAGRLPLNALSSMSAALSNAANRIQGMDSQMLSNFPNMLNMQNMPNMSSLPNMPNMQNMQNMPDLNGMTNQLSQRANGLMQGVLPQSGTQGVQDSMRNPVNQGGNMGRQLSRSLSDSMSGLRNQLSRGLEATRNMASGGASSQSLSNKSDAQPTMSN